MTSSMKMLSIESGLSKCELSFLVGSEPRSLFQVLRNGFLQVLSLSAPSHGSLRGTGFHVPALTSSPS